MEELHTEQHTHWCYEVAGSTTKQTYCQKNSKKIHFAKYAITINHRHFISFLFIFMRSIYFSLSLLSVSFLLMSQRHANTRTVNMRRGRSLDAYWFSFWMEREIHSNVFHFVAVRQWNYMLHAYRYLFLVFVRGFLLSLLFTRSTSPFSISMR